jgi:hypothetical protein
MASRFSPDTRRPGAGHPEEREMRKFVLLAVVGAAVALAAPQFASATPAAPGAVSAAADNVSSLDQVWHRHWHRRHWHHRHCWHRRYWSGRRCHWY